MYRLVILYEDAVNCMRFVHQLSDAPFFSQLEIELLDAGLNRGTLTMPRASNADDGGMPTLVFSRCSGSYLSRQHAQSPSIIESLLYTAEHTCDYTVFNGGMSFRLESNKMLAFIYLSSDLFRQKCKELPGNLTGEPHFRCPKTIGITKLDTGLFQRAVQKHGLGGSSKTLFIKGLVGGESSTVRRVSHTNEPGRVAQQLNAMHRNAAQLFGKDIIIVQDEVPRLRETGVHFRFELIAHRVYYVIRIAAEPQGDSAVPPNFCLADMDEEDDPNISLQLFQSAEALADACADDGLHPAAGGVGTARTNAASIFRELEMFSRAHNVHTLAAEGTFEDGNFVCFDVNTSTNYHSRLEKAAGVEPAAWQVVQSMFMQ